MGRTEPAGLESPRRTAKSPPGSLRGESGGALDEGALDEGALDEGALDEGALDETVEIHACRRRYCSVNTSLSPPLA